jgi:cytochrome c peroxidase
MGMLFTLFNRVRPGYPVDAGTLQHDAVWNIDGQLNVRRVEPRNTPTVINAVFNFTNFWEGRANPHFNGINEFGKQDPTAAVVVNRPGEGLAFEFIAMDNASLASQALAPPLSASEMSFAGRSFPEIGLKLLRPSPRSGVPLAPLGLQKVHRQDSVLGPLSNAPRPGLSTTYEAMIKQAFTEQYWNSTETIDTPTIVFTQMEFNFGLFFGLAVAMYEATLVADQSPFDQWMETGYFNGGFGVTELAGLNLFVHQGQCISCHSGPELTAASVRNAQGGKNLIRATHLVSGTALHDNGFYNIAVTPTTDDIGRGGADLFGQPLAFARQALFDRPDPDTGQPISPINFPIIGNEDIPDEDIQLRRVAVDGAFKTPGLRNVELTGPYFHNGGMATLRQVVQFFNRGGNFCGFNRSDLDQRIKPLGLSRIQEEQLVDFLVSLTDRRVKYQKAPFDHPELRIPEHGLAISTFGMQTIEAVGAHGSYYPLRPFLDLDPQDAIYTPKGRCMPDQSLVSEME